MVSPAQRIAQMAAAWGYFAVGFWVVTTVLGWLIDAWRRSPLEDLVVAAAFATVLTWRGWKHSD